MTYVSAQEWHRERKRLAGIEAGADPISCDVLSRLEVGPGWRCALVAVMVAAGLIRDEEVAAALTLGADPSFCHHVACSGVRMGPGLGQLSRITQRAGGAVSPLTQDMSG